MPSQLDRKLGQPSFLALTQVATCVKRPESELTQFSTRRWRRAAIAEPPQRHKPALHLDQQQTLGDSGDALTHRDCRLVVAEEEPGQHRDGEGYGHKQRGAEPTPARHSPEEA